MIFEQSREGSEQQNHVGIGGKSVGDKGNGKCQVSETLRRLACSRKIGEASATGVSR